MLKEEGDQPKNSLEEGLRNSGMQHGGVIPPFRGAIIGQPEKDPIEFHEEFIAATSEG